MLHNCTHIQQQLTQAIVKKQWDTAASVISQYDACIAEFKQSATPIAADKLHQYRSAHSRMERQLQLAMQQIRDDIADIDQTINRLERGKAFINAHTDKT